MPHFRATIEYDGTDLYGFQYQHEFRTVQGELEKALLKMTGSPVKVAGAGRTDTGVHATGQVITFTAETRIPYSQLSIALNSFLPRDISVTEAQNAPENFHARFSAVSRTYIYAILNRRNRSAYRDRYMWHIPATLDLDAMRKAAQYLHGETDYRAWATSLEEAGRTVRCIQQCSVRKHGECILIKVKANAFLRGMVRTIVGTLVQVGAEKRPPHDIQKITESRDRRLAGPSAPARGLCLVRVGYPENPTQSRTAHKELER
jgi:tRNA pseudouridine38-40 synthase